MSVFSRLAKDTAIYGITTIIARLMNYLFVPLYTRLLSTGEYGIYTEIFGYIPLLMVFLTFGLETGFFRYASRDNVNPNLVFSTILRFLLITSLLFFIVIYLFSGSIATLMGYYKQAVVYTAGILAIDSFTSVLFAKLRYERKAVRFATFRTIKIMSEVLLNFVLFFGMPKYFANNPDSFLLNFIPATPHYLYIFAAVFGSCIISLLLFLPDLLRTTFKYSKSLMKGVLIYSLPLMVAGIPGIANDFIDRILFRFFAPTSAPWQSQLGIFSANVKIAVLMLLFVQMFRYAAEPFFFSSSNQPNIKKVYADVMKYFTAFCMVIFVFIMMYINIFEHIIGKEFRSGIIYVPIMLMANVLLGINQNISMWYKLSEKTNMAIIVTLSGLTVTLLINIIFMPIYGGLAAAWAHLFSYLVMVFLSYRLSKKYYFIPYDWKRIAIFISMGLLIYIISIIIPYNNIYIKLGINTILFLGYLLFLIKIEKFDLKKIVSKVRMKISK